MKLGSIRRSVIATTATAFKFEAMPRICANHNAATTANASGGKHHQAGRKRMLKEMGDARSPATASEEIGMSVDLQIGSDRGRRDKDA